MLFPLASLVDCDPAAVNDLLVTWGHRMGPCERPAGFGFWAHQLLHEGQPVALTVTAALVRERVGGGLQHLTRANTIELARVCAVRPGLCRVMVRMWREFLFPTFGKPHAISYQDSNLHRGDLYRFDGWQRLAEVKASGTDHRTGRKGRPRVIWGWPHQELPTKKETHAQAE